MFAAPEPCRDQAPPDHVRGDRFPVDSMVTGLRPITTESTGESAPIIGYFVSIIRADSPVTPDVMFIING
jgi:hypothetical protein